MMKKMIALLLAALVGVSLALCSCDKDDVKTDDDNNKIAGGWTAPDSPAVPKEVRDVLAKATETLTGGTYEPVAYLGSQVVAGTNYRVLCKYTPAIQNPTPKYVIVTVYEDPQGNTSLSEVLTSDAEVRVTDEVTDGGWFAPETPDVTNEAGEALLAASKNVVGAAYNPVALLGTQVVAGTNYTLLCEVTPVTENAESHYSIVIVTVGADENTYILETLDFSELG